MIEEIITLEETPSREEDIVRRQKGWGAVA